MDNTINPLDEMRLTRAISDAATVAAADTSKDRNELLAKSLLDNRVDSRFAKVASAAFNKQLSVLTFQNATDETRADSFQLSDSDRVLELMGASTCQKKVASAEPNSAPFKIGIVDPNPAPMQKAASEKPARPNFEDTVSKERFKLHVLGMMDKYAAAHNRLIGELDNLKVKVERERDELATELRKSASFAFHTACNVFGDELKKAMQDKLPEMDFTKTANVVAFPTPLNMKIATLLYDIESRDLLNDAIADYQTGLLEFSKTAADEDGNPNPVADYAPPVLGTAIRVGALVPASVLSTASNMADTYKNTLSAGYSNAAKLHDSKDVGVAPASVLSADFLLRDRMRDRMLGWSDMSADKNFAQYPAEEVFLATQRAMDLDSNLERRDRREYLRALVGKLLAQRNRLGEADVAAWSTVEQNLGRRDTARERILQQMRELNKVEAPQRPELANLLDNWNLKNDVNESEAANKRTDKLLESLSKTHEERAKRTADAAKEKSESEKKQQEQREQLRRDFLKALSSKNLYINPANPNQLEIHDKNGKLLGPYQQSVSDMWDSFQKQYQATK